ncbi:7646_t:CDS:2, partial [Funneliformis geosporum]
MLKIEDRYDRNRELNDEDELFSKKHYKRDNDKAKEKEKQIDK